MWNPNNPFLYDIMALEEPEQQAGGSGVPQLQQQPLLLNAPADQHGNAHNVKLPEFWPHAPAMWFARAECRFEIMAGERQKFCCVADALPRTRAPGEESHQAASEQSFCVERVCGGCQHLV
jgi:hypothetical protein